MFDVIKYKTISFLFSGILCLLSLIAIVFWGFTPGIDFTGGSLLEVSFSETRPTLEEIQTTVETIALGNVTIQPAGEQSFILKTPFLSEEKHQEVLATIRQMHGSEQNTVIEERLETIGPSISAQLKKRAFTAGIIVNMAIVLYVAYAFRKSSNHIASWKYGIVAIITLVHDVLITMGVFSLLGHVWGVEIDIAFIVALLTILGYSVNDTIVVFDRIRENVQNKTHKTFQESINAAVNQSFARSINTSFTTIIVMVAVLLFGGDSVHYFALALIIGIFFGAYSSIFLASPLLAVWESLDKKTT